MILFAGLTPNVLAGNFYKSANKTKVKTRTAKKKPVKSKKKTVKKPAKKTAKSKPKKTGKPTLNEKQRANLIKTMKYAASSVRQSSISASKRLAKSEHKYIGPVLASFVKKDLDPAVRAAAATVLGHFKMYPEILRSRLEKEPKEEVKQKLVYALKDMKDKKAGAVFYKVLQKQDLSENNNLAISLIDGLGQIKDKRAEAAALKHIHDKKINKDIQFRFLLYLGAVKSQKARPDLIKMVQNRSGDMAIRSYAVNALGKIGDRRDAKVIRAELEYINSLATRQKNVQGKLRRHLIQAAIRLGQSKELLPIIVAGVKDDDANMRIASINYLGDIKEKSVVELLTYVKKYDRSPRVKRVASSALKKIQGK